MKDPTEFRQRFAAWKNGEKVYKDGLPAYRGGKGSGKINYSRWDNAELTSYPVPFIDEKRITLTNAGRATGAVLSTNLLDSIADNANRAGLPLQTALGLAVKESTLGNPTDDRSAWKLSSGIRQAFNNKYPGTEQHINYWGDALNEREDVINYHKGHQSDDPASGHKSVLQEAFEFYKQHPDKYNAGQKDYQTSVDKRGVEVMQSPEVKRWRNAYNTKRVVRQWTKPHLLLKESRFNKPAYKDGKLPGYYLGTEGDKPITVGEYNIYPSAIGASELNVTTPEVVVTGKDKSWMYKQRDPGTITQDDRSIGEKFWDSYIGKLKYSIDNNKVIGGEYTLPAIGLGALGMYAAGAAGTMSAAPTLQQAVNIAGKNIYSTAARNLALSILGGTAWDNATEMITGNSWGQNVSNLTGGWVPTAISDFTNPGYLLSGEAGNIASQNTKNISADLFTRGKGLYRRVKNFVAPKDHEFYNPGGTYTQEFRDKYMLPWDIVRKKATGISNALANSTQAKWLFNVRLKPKSNPGEFVQTETPIKVTVDGKPITGTQYGLKYNTSTEYEPLWGQDPWDDASFPVLRNQASKGGLDVLPISYTEGADISREYPLRNSTEFTEQLAQHLANIQNQYGVPVVGSTRLISEGYFGGAPGDMEIIAPKRKLKEVEDLFNFVKLRDTRGGTGVTGTSDKVLSGAESNNLDINLIDDTGTIIHQLESTRNPSKMPQIYTQNAEANAQKLGTPTKSADLKIPKNDGSGEYTAEEYFDELLKDQNTLTQSIIDNTFKSGQSKHVQRAFVMMNSDDPKTIEKVSTAIDHMVQQIPGMHKFSEIYPTQKFDNVEKNKEILTKIGFVPIDIDKFASNPESMKNIVDYWYMRNTVATRSVNFDPSKGGSYDNVMSATRSFDNGSSAGGGGNNVLGSTFGGFTRNHTQYTYYPPVVSKSSTQPFDDVFNAFQREATIFEDRDAVKKAITDVLNENNLPIDIGNFNRFDSWFTDDITRLVNNKQISSDEADFIISQVAKKLGVSGYRGKQYSNLGKYFGAMRKPNYEFGYPSFYARRNIDSGDHNIPTLPAEWGSDEMFFSDATQSAKTRGLVYGMPAEFSTMSIQDAARQYPENITDLAPFVEKAKQLASARDPQIQPIHFKLSKGFDRDIADEASGYNVANEAYVERNKHLNEQMQKLRDLATKHYLRKRKIKDAKRAATAAALGVGFGMVAIPQIVEQLKRQDDFTYYMNNKDRMDSIIDNKFGKGAANKWYTDTIDSDEYEELDNKIYRLLRLERSKSRLRHIRANKK